MNNKKKIGITFSAFDFMHPGHMVMLKDAKAQCEHLIVGIHNNPANDDDKAYRSKTGAKNAPIYTLEERIEMIEAVKYIDEYFIYETEQDLHKWLVDNDWSVRILGSDWEGKEFTGYEITKGRVHFHKRDHGLSSTEIKRRLVESGGLIFKKSENTDIIPTASKKDLIKNFVYNKIGMNTTPVAVK